mmetsp:Transcript_6344/g.24499  ORF Transcript_6344/g.24499 Transcript_6344/m.24499 type:complete len:225 (+) Transcript_6344:769-1443(+)
MPVPDVPDEVFKAASCAGASGYEYSSASRASQRMAARTPPLRSALHASVAKARALATPHGPPCDASMPNWSATAARRTAGHGSIPTPSATKDLAVATHSATTAPTATAESRAFSSASSSSPPPPDPGAAERRRLTPGAPSPFAPPAASMAFFASFAALMDSGRGGRRSRRVRSASIPATMTRRPPSCARPPTPQMVAFSRMRPAIARVIRRTPSRVAGLARPSA